MSRLKEWMGTPVVAVLLLAAGCDQTRDTGSVTSRAGDATSSAPGSKAASQRNVALVRAVNAIPGNGQVDIWAGDSVAFKAVGYQAATDYREIPNHMFKFQLRGPGADTTPLAVSRENLSGGAHYTIVALPGDDPEERKQNLRVLTDDLKPVAAGVSRVRFVNGSGTAHDVDVVLRGREEPLFKGVNFKSEAGWKEVEPMAGTLEIRRDRRPGTLASLGNVKLEGGRSYTFVLSGKPGNYELIQIEDQVR
jgi:Domain of unknown function (DUF4397)